MPGYNGPLFDTVFVSKDVPRHAWVRELIRWGKVFSDLSLAPSYGEGSHGNMSFRSPGGCIITSTKSHMGGLREEDFVEIVDARRSGGRMTVFCKGRRTPSTDSYIHYVIYRSRPRLGAILHGHDMPVLEKSARMKLARTPRERESGSHELFEEIMQALGRRRYLILRNHGILSFGRTPREAGERALRIHDLACARVGTWSAKADAIRALLSRAKKSYSNTAILLREDRKREK